MELTIERLCHVQKRMQTSADKSGDDEVVQCHIGVKGVRVHREQAEELGGLPIGATVPLFNDAGIPLQRMSFLFPKRELFGTGSIEHRKDSGVTIAALELVEAHVADMRFNLDAPEEGNTTYLMSFSLTWKAAGDEVDTVRSLLNRKGCHLRMKFKEPPQQIEAPLAPPADKAKPERKRLAAGESKEEAAGGDTPDPKLVELIAYAIEYVKRTGHTKVPQLQKQLKGVGGLRSVGYNRAALVLEALEQQGIVGPVKADGTRDVLVRFKPAVGGLSQLEQEAAEKARKHPRRDPPPKSRSKR